jgi:hypothetical protein
MRNSSDILTLSAATARPVEDTSAVAAAPLSSRRREIRSLSIMRIAPPFQDFGRSSTPGKEFRKKTGTLTMGDYQATPMP